jgi:hypothetical protein
MGVYRDIITSLSVWWDWIPDQSVFASGEGSGLTLNAAARSANGDWLLVYLSSKTTVSIRMDKLTVGSEAAASWRDPRSGEETTIGRLSTTGVRGFGTPEGWEDAVLVLETL